MTRILRTLLYIPLFCGLSSGYAQENTSFKPQLWLSNPRVAADSLNAFDKLNFHRDLGISKGNLWRSSHKVDSPQHLFLVYKSKKIEQMVSFMGKKNALFLEGKNLRINDTVNLDGYNESYGELLDVQFSNIENGTFWMNPALKDSRIFELVLVDKKATQRPVNEIRTYLSLKYGIDLIDYKQYQYNDKQLWDGGDPTYNRRIFGLARMNYFNLFPSKSMHSKDQDLIVAVADQKQFDEGTFVLLGSNGKNFTFDRKTKQSHRKWLAQTNKDNLKVDISVVLDKLEQAANSFNEYELLVGAKGQQTYSYPAQLTDSLLVFKDVLFHKETGSIVRLKEHRSDVRFDIDNSCDQFELKLEGPSKMEGFRLDIVDETGKNVLSETTRKKIYTVSENSSAYFDVTLEYNNKRISKRIATLSGALKAEDLNKQYTLLGDVLEIRLENPQKMRYQWMKGDHVVAEGNQVSLSQEGSYTLMISNTAGCSVTQNFSVGAAMENEQWRVFPNPARADEQVQVAFNLAQQSQVELAVYQSDGKLVKTMTLGNTQNQTVSLGKFASSAGVYMVVAYIDQIPQIKKIIIK